MEEIRLRIWEFELVLPLNLFKPSLEVVKNLPQWIKPSPLVDYITTNEPTYYDPEWIHQPVNDPWHTYEDTDTGGGIRWRTTFTTTGGGIY